MDGTKSEADSAQTSAAVDSRTLIWGQPRRSATVSCQLPFTLNHLAELGPNCMWLIRVVRMIMRRGRMIRKTVFFQAQVELALVDGNQRSRRAEVRLKFVHLLGACF